MLNASQMCDYGYDIIFKVKDDQIKSSHTGEIMIEAVRTNSNVYDLKEKL